MGKKKSLSKAANVEQWTLCLVPFFIFAISYFFYILRDEIYVNVGTAVWKSLPVLSLIYFIYSYHHVSHSDSKATLSAPKLVLCIGMAFHAIGDYFLAFGDVYFLHGMVAFAIGHLFYIYYYGMKPLRPILGISLYLFAMLIMPQILNFVPDPEVRIMVPYYSFLLITLVWRALSQGSKQGTGLFSALGGLLFLASDLLLVIQLKEKLPFGEVMVIGLYYLSQLCTALTTME